MAARCWMLALAIAAMGTLGGTARAQESREPILVVSIREQSLSDSHYRHSARLTRYLEQQLEGIGEIVLSSKGLRQASRASCDPDSLQALGREQLSNLLICGEAQELPALQRRIDLLLYNVRSGRQMTRSMVCPADEQESALSVLVQELLRINLEKATAEPRSVVMQPPRTQLPALPFRPVEPPKLERWRKGVAVGFAVTAALALAVAITETAISLNPPAQGCKYNNATPSGTCEIMPANIAIHYGIAYGAAGLLGIAATLTLVLP